MGTGSSHWEDYVQRAGNCIATFNGINVLSFMSYYRHRWNLCRRAGMIDRFASLSSASRGFSK